MRQGRSVGHALEDAVHVASVSEVLEPRQPWLLCSPDSSKVPRGDQTRFVTPGQLLVNTLYTKLY